MSAVSRQRAISRPPDGRNTRNSIRKNPASCRIFLVSRMRAAGGPGRCERRSYEIALRPTFSAVERPVAPVALVHRAQNQAHQAIASDEISSRDDDQPHRPAAEYRRMGVTWVSFRGLLGRNRCRLIRRLSSGRLSPHDLPWGRGKHKQVGGGTAMSPQSNTARPATEQMSDR
jgi:hypothetical protein